MFLQSYIHYSFLATEIRYFQVFTLFLIWTFKMKDFDLMLGWNTIKYYVYFCKILKMYKFNQIIHMFRQFTQISLLHHFTCYDINQQSYSLIQFDYTLVRHCLRALMHVNLHTTVYNNKSN